jgi:hypothetical protein
MTHRTLLRTLAAALAASLLGTGCSPDRAVAPEADAPSAAAQQNLKGGSLFTPLQTAPGTTVAVLQREKPLKQDATVSATITPRGGYVRIAQAGLTVYFSPGAVSQTMTVTATAYAGSAVAYSFEPHGTQFHAPVYVVQNVGLTTIAHDISLAQTIAGAYMPDGLADLQPDGTAIVSEIHDASVDKIRDPIQGLILHNAVFTIQHFSGYILTGGRH